MDIIIVAHNIRSTYNVGSILRTADGFGVHKVYATGYTPYPTQPHDTRLPHIHQKLTRQIHKTALGAETTVFIEHADDPTQLLSRLTKNGYYIVALEQSAKSISLPLFKAPQKVALLLGEEVNGITANLLAMCNAIIEIPMRGHKESFNVSVATGIAVYELSRNET